MKPWELRVKKNQWRKSVKLSLQLMLYAPLSLFLAMSQAVRLMVLSILSIPILLIVWTGKFSFRVVAGFFGYLSEPLSSYGVNVNE